jgi:hypothetical protein
MREIPVNLVPPSASPYNLPNFLFSDIFIPSNATRTYDAGEAPVPAGPEKIYSRFPAEEPCFSPNEKWQWRFYKYETNREGKITNQILDLEDTAGGKQMEIMLAGPSIRILWTPNSEFTAITSWDDEQTMGIDIVNAPSKSTRPLVLDRVELNRFFRGAELDGRWSMQARAWKNNSLLIVRAVRINQNATDPLCGAEFSVDVRAPKRETATRLLRAFVCELK